MWAGSTEGEPACRSPGLLLPVLPPEPQAPLQRQSRSERQRPPLPLPRQASGAREAGWGSTSQRPVYALNYCINLLQRTHMMSDDCFKLEKGILSLTFSQTS